MSDLGSGQNCPRCGSQLPQMAQFCLHCGGQVSIPQAVPAVGTQSTAAPRRSSAGLLAYLVMAGCLAGAAFVYLAVNTFRSPSIESIHSVRFSEFNFPSTCSAAYRDSGFDQVIRTSNGQWNRGTGADELFFNVGKPLYGDLAGDGHDEAIVPTSCGYTAGSGWYQEIFIFGAPQGKAVLLARLSPADWGRDSWRLTDGGVQVAGQQVLVSYYAGGSHAKPAWIKTTRFEWKGNRFVRVGIDKKPFSAPEAPSSAQSTFVRSTGNGELVLELSESQQRGVTSFLNQNPYMQALTTYVPAAPSPGLEAQRRQNMEAAMKSGEMQFPYASWRDFRGTGHSDLALFFVSKQAVNSWGWRHWQIVIFEEGESDATVVTQFDSGCVDGLVYHENTRTAEFYCFGVAAGTFHWNGQNYDVKPMLGD